MALGSDIRLRKSPDNLYGAVAPCSISGPWITVIDAGGMDDQDAATITNPDTQIILSTRHEIIRGLVGTLLLLRLVYDDGLTLITNPVVKVFGRTGSQAWQLLKTGAGALTATLTTAATDTTDGTYLYTTPELNSQTWDCLGCERLLVGIETALAGTGTVTNAYLEAKII